MTASDTETEPAIEETVEELIIRSARSNYQRLPLLEVVIDRFALALGPMMKSYCAGAVAEATLGELSYTSCGEALETLPEQGLAIVAEVQPSEGDIGVVLDHQLLFAALEIMLGGRTAGQSDWTPRAFSAIERKFGQKLCQAALNTLSEAFTRVWEVSFALDRIESSAQAMVLAAPTAPCVKVVMKIDFDGRGGTLTLLLPQPALEEARSVLAAPFRGGQIGGDSSWRDLLSNTLQGTSVTMDAVLCEPRVSLSDVLSWRVGNKIDLGVTADQNVTVSCGELKLFTAAIGRRRNGSIALRMMQDFSEEDDPTDVDFD